MSYTSLESSKSSGNPIELYKFSMGGVQWLFTNADRSFVYMEDEYNPTYILRGGYTKGNDVDKVSIEITLSDSNPVALLFRDGWLSNLMILTVYRHHVTDFDYVVIWKGRVKSCTWHGSTCSLLTDSVFSSFKKSGLRRVYQAGCPHVLYEGLCGVNKDNFTDVFTVLAISGNTITANGTIERPDGYYTGGFIKFGVNYRMITDHTGNVFTLLDKISTLKINDSVNMWAGCDRSLDTCLNKFDNTINYGGLPYLPVKNPFTGSSIV